MSAYALRIQSKDLLGCVSNDDEHCRYDSVPIELKALRAWLPFRIKLRLSQDDKPKKLKVPYNIAGRKADYTNPREWMTFEGALTMLHRGDYDGIGIVIDRRFGIVGYDADSCIANGTISETAREHIATLSTYTEESFSGTGIHCLAYGTLPHIGRKSEGFEMYCDKRFFVVTGRHVAGTPKRIKRRQAEIEAVHAAIFGSGPVRKHATAVRKSVTQFAPNTQVGVGGVGKRAKVTGLQSDTQVLRVLERDPVAWRYFSSGAGIMNPSRADFALGCKLAFYTRGDLQQMYRLFMQSTLAERAKCHTMRGNVNYVQYTLQRCLSHQKDFWQPSANSPKSRRPVGSPLSAVTKSVLELITKFPSMRACEIARNLSLKPAAVRKVLSRYPIRSFEAKMPARTRSMGATILDEPKPVGSTTHESGPRDAVLQAISKHPGWVKVTTIARETGSRAEAVKKLFQQLRNIGLVDCDQKGRYRKHRERKPRKLKPCRSKPIQRCSGTGQERKSLTRGELMADHLMRTALGDNPAVLAEVDRRLAAGEDVTFEEAKAIEAPGAPLTIDAVCQAVTGEPTGTALEPDESQKRC
jgi:predicted transcriptional regulator